MLTTLMIHVHAVRERSMTNLTGKYSGDYLLDKLTSVS